VVGDIVRKTTELRLFLTSGDAINVSLKSLEAPTIGSTKKSFDVPWTILSRRDFEV